MATLRLYVHGLTLFVPDGEQLHALMPRTGEAAFGKTPEHHCALHIPDGYRMDGQGDQLLKDRHLVLPSSRSARPMMAAQLTSKFGREGPDLYEATQEAIDEQLLNSSADGQLTSRVTIPSGQVRHTYSGNYFRWRGRRILPLPYITVIDIPDLPDRVTLDLLTLDKDPKDSIPLQAASNGLIEVCVSHVTQVPLAKGKRARATAGITPRPRGMLSPHFIALYGLYYNPDEIVMPAFERECGTQTPSLPCMPMTKGDPFTCVHTFASQ